MGHGPRGRWYVAGACRPRRGRRASLAGRGYHRHHHCSSARPPASPASAAVAGRAVVVRRGGLSAVAACWLAVAVVQHYPPTLKQQGRWLTAAPILLRPPCHYSSTTGVILPLLLT